METGDLYIDFILDEEGDYDDTECVLTEEDLRVMGVDVNRLSYLEDDWIVWN